MVVIPFSDSFISQYSDAFNELLRLGTLASQNRTEGKSSNGEDKKADRLLLILQALSKPGLNLKEIEALEYCLHRLNESLVIPTVQSLLPGGLVPVTEGVTGSFYIGTEADSGGGGSSALAFAIDGILASASTFLLFVFDGYLNTSGGGGVAVEDYWGTDNDISNYIPAG
jgi:hypothetical protein